jgi:hypothetical protein
MHAEVLQGVYTCEEARTCESVEGAQESIPVKLGWQEAFPVLRQRQALVDHGDEHLP